MNGQVCGSSRLSRPRYTSTHLHGCGFVSSAHGSALDTDMTHAVPTVSGRDNCVCMMAQQGDPGHVGAQGKEGGAYTEGQLGSSADLGWR